MCARVRKCVLVCLCSSICFFIHMWSVQKNKYYYTVIATPPDQLATTPRCHHTTIPRCHQPTPWHHLCSQSPVIQAAHSVNISLTQCSQSPVNQSVRRPKKVMMSMAQVVFQSVREAADLTCDSCRHNQHLSAVLSRALASAQELIDHMEHGA